MRSTKLTLTLASTLTLPLALAGCKSNQPAAPATIVDMNNGADPAAANLAPIDPNAQNPNAQNAPGAQSSYSAAVPAQSALNGRVLGQRSQAPQTASNGEQYSYPNESTTSPAYDPAYDQYDSQVNAGQDALYADQAPPPLPQYDQPQLTQANDQWTPGYWNYNNSGYYFVPGAWVAPPYDGALWTPGYWGYEGHRYRFHRGFWGRHIGFYGGINYGFGYSGRGYEGGYWNNNNFYYNQRVNRVNPVDVRNVYVRNVTAENDNHFSYNGPGGYQTRPVPAELAVYHEQRLPPQQSQVQVREQAAGNRQQFFTQNHGQPAVAAAPQHFNADTQPARPIQPVERGGFGQPGSNNAAQQQQIRAQQLQQNEQRTQQNQVRTQQAQQQTAEHQQHNALVQQQEQQHQQQLQQRSGEQQQRAQQLQQRSTQPLNPQQQQNVQAQQQRNAAVQQQNQQRQQQVQAQQQRTQQNAQAQQQRAAQEQQRSQQETQRTQQEAQRSQQEQQHTQQLQQREATPPQPARPAPQPRPQLVAPQARPQPAAPAARAQPAPQQHTEAPKAGGERPPR